MPSSPCEPNDLKFGMRGFYLQPNNLQVQVCLLTPLNKQKKQNR